MGSKRRSINRRSKKQRLYKMKGCSRKRCAGGRKNNKKNKSHRHISRQNLFVTYTGGNHDTFPVSTQVPSPYGGQFGSQTGGGCDCCSQMKGGGKRGGKWQKGGKWQSGGCGDSMCSLGGGARGGGAQGGGASALVGAPWDPTNPGALPVPNHYALNEYIPDISRQMIATGAQPPFSVGGGARGGRRGGARGGKRRRMYKGGGLLDYGPYIAGSVTSALGGYKGPVSPSPVVGQFASSAEHI